MKSTIMLLINLLTFYVVTVQVTSRNVAPGDEQLQQCGLLRAAGAAPVPTYSANMRVLMDSWNYQNLLPPRTGAVWDQVDNDNNNPVGITSTVSDILDIVDSVCIRGTHNSCPCIYAVDSGFKQSLSSICPCVWVQCWSTE